MNLKPKNEIISESVELEGSVGFLGIFFFIKYNLGMLNEEQSQGFLTSNVEKRGKHMPRQVQVPQSRPIGRQPLSAYSEPTSSSFPDSRISRDSKG